MSDQLSFIWDQLPNLLWGFPNQRPGGLLLSILLSAGAIGVGLVLALTLGFGTHSHRRLVRAVSSRFIWLVRGIPLIVLLVLLFQFLGTGGLFGIRFSAFWTAAVTLVMYSAAYQADIISGGIAAVPQQLRDDARVLGAGPLTVARTITIPHCLRSMRFALITQAITIFKDSSVVVVLGVADLTTNARIALGGDVTRAPFWVATYLAVGLLYWIVAFSLGRLAQRSARSQTHAPPARREKVGAHA